MHQRTLAIVFSIVSYQAGFSQQLFYFNSVKIDSLRYQEVEGTPFLYDSWRLAKLTNRDGTVYNVRLNFNGYEQKFEVDHSSYTATLNEDQFEKIEVLIEKGDSTQEWFIRGVHFEIALKLSNVIYRSDKILLIREFKVRLAEFTNEIYGDPEVHKKFVPARYYAILYKSKLYQITLNKKRLGKVFNDRELIDATIKQHKLKLSNEDDLIKLMALLNDHLDSQN